jgi:hypothetical protein
VTTFGLAILRGRERDRFHAVKLSEEEDEFGGVATEEREAVTGVFWAFPN